MNVLLSVLVGLFAGVVTFWFGGYVGLQQPLLGLAAFIVFVVVTYLGVQGRWFGRKF